MISSFEINFAIGFIVVVIGFFSMIYNMVKENNKSVNICFITCCAGILYLVILLMVVMINGK